MASVFISQMQLQNHKANLNISIKYFLSSFQGCWDRDSKSGKGQLR